jgi:peptide/nickel transport system permease protein
MRQTSVSKSSRLQRSGETALWRTSLRSILRSPTALFGLAIVVVMTFAAVAAPFLGLRSPTLMDLTAPVQPPSAAHLLGTDSFGRDLLSRVTVGAQISLFVGVASTLLSLVLGTPVGLIAGYRGGRIDAVLMRVMDAVFSFPPILLTIALVGVLGGGLQSVVIALALVYTPGFARQARASALVAVHLEYVEAARAVGARELRILLRHVLPMASGPLLVRGTVLFAYAIVAEAGLSFLGLGAQPPTPSWGQMLTEARSYLQSAPWFPLVPALAIVAAVLGPTLLGDWLQLLIDPRQRRRLD